MELQSCLPAALRGSATTITPVSAGLSGAGVYRVEAHGQTFVLKVSDAKEPPGYWRERLRVQQLAADAGLAPRIVHTDETRRSVLSAFVQDRSFAMLYLNPATRDRALELLATTLRRVHELPLGADTRAGDAREFLSKTWAGLTSFPLPAFVGDAVRRVQGETPPIFERPAVLSHNDVNPTNLVYDGERLVLLDWETAAPNDPFYDLAAISVFFRMDDATCVRLLELYDGAPVATLPARFAYDRRLAATMVGVVFLHLARQLGHPGATGDETLESTLSLGDFYQRLRAGGVEIASAAGQWLFGLALLKHSTML